MKFTIGYTSINQSTNNKAITFTIYICFIEERHTDKKKTIENPVFHGNKKKYDFRKLKKT